MTIRTNAYLWTTTHNFDSQNSKHSKYKPKKPHTNINDTATPLTGFHEINKSNQADQLKDNMSF